MTTQGFSTSHAQPFTLEEAILLDVNTLIQEIARLRNSIAHLTKTQDELRSFLEEEPEDEDGEIGLAIKENEETITSQTERIDLIRVALESKVGKEGLKHYGSGLGFDLEGSDTNSKGGGGGAVASEGGGTGQARSVPESGSSAAEAGDEGLHL